MASIYKKKYPIDIPNQAEIIDRRGRKVARWTNGKGQTRTAELIDDNHIQFVSDCWYMQYRDAHGIMQRRSTNCRERQAAEKVLADILADIEKVKSGVMTASQMTTAGQMDLPIEKHTKAYLAQLVIKTVRGRRVSPKHVAHVTHCLNRIVADCRFRTLKDIDRQAVQRWMAKQAHTALSARTINIYRAAMVAMCNWCLLEGRLTNNPLAGLPKAEETEPARKRRALTDDEIVRLLDTAKRRPLRDALTIRRGKNKGKPLAKVSNDEHLRLKRLGQERALIYKFMILTGLRCGEVKSLTIANLCLDENSPYIHIDGKHAKSGRAATLPLRVDLAQELREHVAGLDGGPQTALFRPGRNFLRTFNLDLAAAGIAKRDARGRTVDVHSLRHTFATLLARNAVSPGIAQKLMRHSDIRLTMNLYTHLELADTASAVAGLPSFLR